MFFSGILIGLFSFAVIGIFHPIVIKCEYYFTCRVWPVFLATGLLFLTISLLTDAIVVSSCFGVAGFACFWSIGELREQAQRVRKGWFPANPNMQEQKSQVE